jgi:Glycosyltransferase family 87
VRRPLSLIGLLAAFLLGPVGVSRAVSVNQSSTATDLSLPLVRVSSATLRPSGFSIDAQQAVAAAKASPTIQALHRHEHPLIIQPLLWTGAPPYWFINFLYHGRIVAEINVDRTGRAGRAWTGPQAIATYARGGYAPGFDSWWVVVPFSVLFMLPFLNPRRLWRLVHLDALALLSFLVSYGLFDDAHLQTAVWLAYPPLIYLLLRMIWIGVRGRTDDTRLSPLFSSRVLFIGLLVLVGGRIALSLAGPIIDVGSASVVGAHRIVSGQSLYYATAAHNDTYGPVAYLAYVPFQLLFPWHGVGSVAPAARAASIAFDLVTILGLLSLGRRLRQGRDGLRLGLVLAWAWAACPFTLLALMEHTNDGLIAMLSVLSLLVFSSPAARGAVLALAAAAKFSPAALLPLYAGQRGRGWKGALMCVVSFAFVVGTAIGLYLPSEGISEFYNHTIGFQLNRPDVFSPWALHPGLAPIKTVLEAAAVLLAGVVAFVPRQRSMGQVCALAAAVTIAVQLPAVHWFYYYIVWFVPFVLVALLVPSAPDSATAVTRGDAEERSTLADDRAPEPALAGA